MSAEAEGVRERRARRPGAWFLLHDIDPRELGVVVHQPVGRRHLPVLHGEDDRRRFERTGRNVPAKLVQDTFEMLNLAVDTYIRQQAHICDRVLLYDNDARQMALAATVCGGEGEAEALAVAQKYLGPSPTK